MNSTTKEEQQADGVTQKLSENLWHGYDTALMHRPPAGIKIQPKRILTFHFDVCLEEHYLNCYTLTMIRVGNTKFEKLC